MKEKSFFNKLEENVIAVGIIIMVVMETLNVVCRMINPSLNGVPEEIAVFAYTFVCFLCASYCTKKGENIIVDALTKKYNKKLQGYLQIIQYSIDTLISVLFLYGSVLVVITTKASGNVGVTGIPLWIIYTAPILGFSLNVVRNLQNIVKETRNKQVDVTDTVTELVAE